MKNKFDLVVIGGGAAGFMGAIKAAEDGVKNVAVLEATAKNLEKVRISGGGRCNVTHACWIPIDLLMKIGIPGNLVLKDIAVLSLGKEVRMSLVVNSQSILS